MRDPLHQPSQSKARKRLLVGSRDSGLALQQTEEVLEQIRSRHGDREFEVLTIKTGGDVSPDAPLIGMGRGIFVKEIERALLDGEIDLAVHSLKDLPTRLPEHLAIGAVSRRLDARDVLVNRWGLPLADLPTGSRIGTSSPRRVAQLKSLRPDVEALPIRGNVDTRLRKANSEEYDGAILAAAGIIRLGRQDEIAEYLSPADFVPPPGQGALAVEVRESDDVTLELIAVVEDAETRRNVTAERAFLQALGGGCQMPVGAYARCDGDTMVMSVFLASPNGGEVFKTKVRGRADNPHEVALDAYQRLVEMGAQELLRRTAAQAERDIEG